MTVMDLSLQSFPYAAVFAVLAAIACYRTVVAQSRGQWIKRWRLSTAPVFGSLAAVTLLYKASLATPCLAAWSVVVMGGFAIGAISGRSIRLQVDLTWRLVRSRWGFDSALAALVILISSFSAAAFGLLNLTILEWGCVAAIAAGFCAGLLGGRAWMVIKKALYVANSNQATP